MNAIIDLNSEVLVDRSRVRNPYLRMLLTAIGQEVAKDSAWVAIDKRVAAKDAFLLQLVQPIDTRPQQAAA